MEPWPRATNTRYVSSISSRPDQPYLTDVLNAGELEKERERLPDTEPFGDALNDPSIFNELAAAGVPEDGAVQERGLREHLPTVRKYAREPNYVTRVAAIVALSDWADEVSRPAFDVLVRPRYRCLMR